MFKYQLSWAHLVIWCWLVGYGVRHGDLGKLRRGWFWKWHAVVFIITWQLVSVRHLNLNYAVIKIGFAIFCMWEMTANFNFALSSILELMRVYRPAGLWMAAAVGTGSESSFIPSHQKHIRALTNVEVRHWSLKLRTIFVRGCRICAQKYRFHRRRDFCWTREVYS